MQKKVILIKKTKDFHQIHFFRYFMLATHDARPLDTHLNTSFCTSRGFAW
jgi:hypothetical protein